MEERIPYQTTRLYPPRGLLPVPLRTLYQHIARCEAIQDWDGAAVLRSLAVACSHRVDEDVIQQMVMHLKGDGEREG